MWHESGDGRPNLAERGASAISAPGAVERFYALLREYHCLGLAQEGRPAAKVFRRVARPLARPAGLPAVMQDLEGMDFLDCPQVDRRDRSAFEAMFEPAPCAMHRRTQANPR